MKHEGHGLPLASARRALQRFFCRHEFKLADLKPRDETDNVSWPCCKCGRIFREHCGLFVLGKHGKISK